VLDSDSPPSHLSPKQRNSDARYTTLPPSLPRKTAENGVPAVPPRKHSSPSSGKDD